MDIAIMELGMDVGELRNKLNEVINKAYTIGCEHEKEAYQKGLEAAWETARKIMFDETLPREMLDTFGTDTFCGVILKCSVNEAMEKLSAYEAKKIMCEQMGKAVIGEAE